MRLDTDAAILSDVRNLRRVLEAKIEVLEARVKALELSRDTGDDA